MIYGAMAWMLTLFGCFTFPALYHTLVNLQKRFLHDRLNDEDIYTITVRFVSTFQSVCAITVGSIIITSCSRDVMHDTHWLTNSYTWFGWPYFYYDTWAMYQVYWYKHPEVQSIPKYKAVRMFIRSQPVMMCHHLLLPVLYFPVIVWYRNNLGDFFVGCFYMVELAIPFISLRYILLQLGKEKTLLYTVNGLSLIVVFAVSRILIFPFMFWHYSLYKGISILDTPFVIPKKCTIGSTVILAMMLYWWVYMVKVAIKTTQKLYSKPPPSEILKVQ